MFPLLSDTSFIILKTIGCLQMFAILSTHKILYIGRRVKLLRGWGGGGGGGGGRKADKPSILNQKQGALKRKWLDNKSSNYPLCFSEKQNWT